MEKEQEQKPTNESTSTDSAVEENNVESQTELNTEENEIPDEKETTSEEKIKELEDKLARTFAEMENQRRRFEKEKEDAFEYGGYSFAKEALNLIDNLDRSKHVLESDDKLKETEALKKTLEHLDIIKKDLRLLSQKKNHRIQKHRLFLFHTFFFDFPSQQKFLRAYL